MLSLIDTGEKAPDEVNVIIEIPAHSEPVKYEVDKKTGAMMVDRFMSTSMRYPCDYGYIPNTLGNDGDPLDVLVVSPLPLISGSVIKVRPVGYLAMTDEAGGDEKIIAVPINKLTMLYEAIQEPADLGKLLLDRIAHFFAHYKDLEADKWVKIEGWQNQAAAKELIKAGIKRFKP